MKKGKHPECQEVLFVDSSTGKQFLILSTYKGDKKANYEGREVTLCEVSTSSDSHPFFKGTEGFVDSEKRIEAFLKRYQ